jgi:ribonuclease HI
MKTLDVYTDGSYISATDRGGYGIVIQNGKITHKYSGAVISTTSNRMELIAVIEALKILKKEGRVRARVFSDSLYVINAARFGWLETWADSGWVRHRGRELKNADLWKEFYPLYLYHDVEFFWIERNSAIHDISHEMAYKEAKGD